MKKVNPHYATWLNVTGGGRNWEFMAWVSKEKSEWLKSGSRSTLTEWITRPRETAKAIENE